jgi:hypothetical protein
MKIRNLDFEDRILFILGMSLCGVFFFVLAAGVIVALFTSKYGEKRIGANDSFPLQDEEPTAALKAEPDE